MTYGGKSYEGSVFFSFKGQFVVEYVSLVLKICIYHLGFLKFLMYDLEFLNSSDGRKYCCPYFKDVQLTQRFRDFPKVTE